MAESTFSLAPGRLVLLARVAGEGARLAADRDAQSCSTFLLDVADKSRAEACQLAGQFGSKATAGGSQPVAVEGSPAVQQIQRERARLELERDTARQELGDVQKSLRKIESDHREAVSSLTLQRKRLEELQQERSALFEQVGELESRLAESQNETERVNLQYEKLKSSRRQMGDQATELTEQINALKAENERLRQEREAALQERDRYVQDADARTEQYKGASEDAAFRALWQAMSAEVPQVFTDTHVPDRKSFERVCDAATLLVQMLAHLELAVHEKLREYRNVNDPGDRLGRVYNTFKATQGILEALRDYLVSGKRRSHFVNLRRAIQAWLQAFATGPHKAIVRAPGIVDGHLNFRQWPINASKDAAIGQYFREQARREIPDRVGNAMKKEAADRAFEDAHDFLRARV